MYYVNPQVEDLDRIFDQNSRDGYLRVDLNENPGGLPEDFIREVLDNIDPEFISKYPETEEFQKKLAAFTGVEPDQICLTNGSAEAIRHIIEAFTQPGGKIVSVAPSYAMYEVYAKMYGRVHVPVPYRDNFKADADDIIKAIDDDTDLVVLLNPNNPIGDVHTEEEVERVIAAAKEHEASVLIDEAYYYFYPKSLIRFALENDHVFLTRTFSKLFSLAGCRLGYCVGRAEGIRMVQKLCTPHNVNAFGIRFAQAIIEKDGMVDELVRGQLEGKRYLADRLRSEGYRINALEGNFIFIEPRTDAAELTARLRENKVLVKHYRRKPYDRLIRVSTGTKDIMERFLKVFLETDR